MVCRLATYFLAASCLTVSKINAVIVAVNFYSARKSICFCVIFNVHHQLIEGVTINRAFKKFFTKICVVADYRKSSTSPSDCYQSGWLSYTNIRSTEHLICKYDFLNNKNWRFFELLSRPRA